MQILVTGGSGFIGRNCAARLAACGHPVTCVDNLSAASAVASPSGLRRVDVRELTPEDLADVDAVLHLAALKSVPGSFSEPDQILHNIEVDHHVLRIFTEAARPRRLVMASSCEVYGDQAQPAPETLHPRPRSPYAVGKVASEYLASVYRALKPDKQVCVLRLHNVFGPDEGGEAVISSFIDAILDQRPLVIEGDGAQARDFTHIDDACEMIVRVLLDPGRPADTLNIGSGAAVTVAELADVLRALTDGRLTVEFGQPRPNEVSAFRADMTRYRDAYGPVPGRPLWEGLRQALARRTALRGAPAGPQPRLATARR